MRLFQAQDCLEEYNPPPPFNADREVTRSMPVYLNQFRDGKQRLPTPEKVAIMELSGSFDRRRLGKHQQILTDITQRCREQEVSDLSSGLSAKIQLQQLERPSKEMTFYSTTNFLAHKQRQATVFPEIMEPSPRLPADPANSCRVNFEKSYKNFPARKMIRQPTKFEFIKTAASLPALSTARSVAAIPRSSVSDSHLLRSSDKHPKHGEHKSPRMEHLAPLVMPRVTENDFLAKRDRMDTYFLTNKVTLGPRTRTNLTLDSVRSGRPGGGHLKPVKVTYPREMSQLHLETGGNSPPPNSEQEPEMVTV